MARKCYRCFRSREACLCSRITPFHTDARIVILMHPMEARRQRTGTGRLTSMALINSELIIGIDFSQNKRVLELLDDSRYHAMMLYPGEEAVRAHEVGEEFFGGKAPLIFVIDGTWPCAKKMVRLSSNLRSLPRVSFSTSFKSRFRIKQQPHPDCLSTIESVHVLLSELGEQKSSHLLEILDMMVEYQVERATDPNASSYRTKPFVDGEKKNYKKARSRRIFY